MGWAWAQARLPSGVDVQLGMKRVCSGHHLGTRADAPGVWTQRQLANAEILPRGQRKERETCTAKKPNVDRRHHGRFMDNVLPIIANAAVEAFMQISKRHRLAY